MIIVFHDWITKLFSEEKRRRIKMYFPKLNSAPLKVPCVGFSGDLLADKGFFFLSDDTFAFNQMDKVIAGCFFTPSLLEI